MFTNMKYTGHLLALASVASAHYTFSKIAVNGEVQGSDWTYIREHTRGYMPTKVQEILENDFRCQPGGDSGANTQVLAVNAGDEVDFQGAFGMTSIEHPGPAQVYFSKAPGDDVQSYAGDGDWFKVREALLCSSPAAGADLTKEAWCTWGEDGIKFEVPSNIPSGQYLVRVEHIPLHGAQGSPDGAEYYYSCGQLEVTGSSGEIPAETGQIPGMIQPDDEAVIFNIWTGASEYSPFPGTPLIEGGTQWGSADGTSDAVTGGSGGGSTTQAQSASASTSSSDDESAADTSYSAPQESPAADATYGSDSATSSSAPQESAAAADSYGSESESSYDAPQESAPATGSYGSESAPSYSAPATSSAAPSTPSTTASAGSSYEAPPNSYEAPSSPPATSQPSWSGSSDNDGSWWSQGNDQGGFWKGAWGSPAGRARRTVKSM
ncbi:hypothetical protein KC340_g9872 [Hortaea werneckii]|nr:hypothetical protein KC342_g7631 [Hortaea werneckii]KAI7097390.1 hypothetical protein KC339_g9730 [Hortaea werneckii]KAI7212295.1 hypothetical protein KC365_g14647 [Hortaea werneckii]KAI7312451.1 hypothetical protein KC340_g9872 [Hortaea werneckii]KAI7396203.1 hypothetical protein KC328_g5403 [Hortaea werneckii]